MLLTVLKEKLSHIWHTVHKLQLLVAHRRIVIRVCKKSNLGSKPYTAVCKIVIVQTGIGGIVGGTRLVIKQQLATLVSCVQNEANRLLQQRGLTGVFVGDPLISGRKHMTGFQCG